MRMFGKRVVDKKVIMVEDGDAFAKNIFLNLSLFRVAFQRDQLVNLVLKFNQLTRTNGI